MRNAPAPKILVLFLGLVLLAGCANITKLRQEQADAHYRMANSYLQQGRGFLDEVNRRKAFPELQQAIQLDPNNAGYRLVLGTLYLYNDEFIAAEREIKKALVLDPNLGDAHNNLGLVYVEQGRLNEAIVEFKKAVGNLSYQTAEIGYFNLGRSSFLVGDYAQAVTAFEKSLAIYPGNAEARYLIGRSFVKLGKLAPAVDAFTKVLEQNPGSARAHYELAIALFKLHRKEEAAPHFEKVVELDPGGEFAGQAKTFLKLLR